MTVLRVYQKNGHPVRKRNSEYRFSDLVNDLFGDNYQPASYSPKVNINEMADFFEIELALPGIKKENVNINIEKDILKISSRENNTDAKQMVNYNRREFDYTNFERTFNLPDTVNTEKIGAKMENGILTVTLPKKDDAIDRGPREINIS